MFTVAYLKDGSYKEKEFYDRNEANAAFLKLKKFKLPIVTRVEWEEIKYYNGAKQEEFAKAIIKSNNIYTDEVACDIVTQYIDSSVELIEDDYEFKFRMDNEWYLVEHGNIRQDEMFAAMYNEPDKYGYLRIYKGNERLAELRWQL